MRWCKWLSLLVALPAMVGCSICASPFDCEYSAYGGRWQRADMSRGRVGSVFSDPGVAQASDEVIIHEGDSVVEGEVISDGVYDEGVVVEEGDTHIEF